MGDNSPTTVMVVCGGRDFTDKDRLWATLDALLRDRGGVRVIAGGARGADTLAQEWAEARGVPCDVFMANWADLRKAGPMRNQQMLDEGRPPWRARMVRRARSVGVEVIEVGQFCARHLTGKAPPSFWRAASVCGCWG